MTSTSTLCVVDPELKSAMVGDTYVYIEGLCSSSTNIVTYKLMLYSHYLQPETLELVVIRFGICK